MADQFGAVERCFESSDVATAVDLLRLKALVDRRPRQLVNDQFRREYLGPTRR